MQFDFFSNEVLSTSKRKKKNIKRLIITLIIVMLIIRLPKNSENKPRGLYFSKALFEGLISEATHIIRKEIICITKSFGLTKTRKEICVLWNCFCFVLFSI